MIARMSYQQPPQWNQQPSPGPYPPMYPPPRQTNGMAIVALVCSLALAPLGIIFGHIALSQIKRTGEEGRGLAIAGLIIGYVSVGSRCCSS
jgi:peptidyl-prolyl cis-trans isomerase B (cyclophilin B)